MLVIAMVLALCMSNRKTAEFTPPPFEQNAVSGTPEVAQEFGYSSPYKEGMTYRFSVCGNVMTEGNEALVYLTNPAENEVWIKLRVLDENRNVLGETGLIKPGEYVKSVTLNTVPAYAAENTVDKVPSDTDISVYARYVDNTDFTTIPTYENGNGSITLPDGMEITISGSDMAKGRIVVEEVTDKEVLDWAAKMLGSNAKGAHIFYICQIQDDGTAPSASS